jgi:hypothetical protein
MNEISIKIINMKKIILLSFLSITLIQCKDKIDQGIKIHGNIKNSNHEYVSLTFEPRSAGCFNFESFKNIGTRVDDIGSFDIISQNLTDYAKYRLQVNDKFIELFLFNGDDLNFELDAKNIDSSFFVTGKGAGKINVLWLKQFTIRFKRSYKREAFKIFVDSIVSAQSILLDAIYHKDSNCLVVANANNQISINKIIRETPLTEKEYKILKMKIGLLKNAIGEYPKQLCMYGIVDSAIINFSDPYFSYLNDENLKHSDLLYYAGFENYIDGLLIVEYLKDKQKSNPKISYNDWTSFAQDSLFWVNRFSNLKKLFKPESYDRYYADVLSSELSSGDLLYFNRDKIDFYNNCSNSKYIERIRNFETLLTTGLNNKEYNLNDTKYTLNDSTFKILLQSFKGKPVYIALWSSPYVEAGIIPFLPSLYDIEKDFKGDIEFIDICIDNVKNKNLWAAKIIDNNWKGNHYFFPIADKKDKVIHNFPITDEYDSIVYKLNCKGVFGFCEGESYTFIDKDGNMINNCESPRMLTKDKIEKYTKNTVR